MKKDITLTIKGLHLADDEENTMETRHEGSYFFKDGLHHVFTKEENCGVVTDLRLTFDEKFLKVRRSGEITTELTFEPDMMHETMYRTPFGSLPVKTHTSEYYVNLQAIEKGLIEGALKYRLYVDGNVNSDATLVFRIEEK